MTMGWVVRAGSSTKAKAFGEEERDEKRIAAKAAREGSDFKGLSSSILRDDRVMWWVLKAKGKEGFVVLGVGEEIMMLDPKKSEERNEVEAIATLLLLGEEREV